MAGFFQKYRLKWPWTPTQVVNVDQMFQEIYDNFQSLQKQINDLTAIVNALASSSSSSSSSNGAATIIQGGGDGDQGVQGPPGYVNPIPTVDSLVIGADAAGSLFGVIYKGVAAVANRFIHTFNPGGSAFGGNTFIGMLAGNFNTAYVDASHTASENTAVGYNAMNAATSGSTNVFIGAHAAELITSGFENVGVGHNVLKSLTTGSANVGVGKDCMTSLQTGNSNTAVGIGALHITTTTSNTAVGDHACGGDTTGVENVGIGYHALNNNATGSDNVAVGSDAMSSGGSSNSNTAIGHQALVGLSGGSGLNVAVGKNAGFSCTSDDSCTLLGYFADRSGGAAITNSIAIGLGTKVGASNTAEIGNSTVTTTHLFKNVGISTTTPTAALHLPAGAAGANNAPLKFTSGTNLTTAEAGAAEYNGTNLFFTRTGTTRENVLVAVDNATAPTTTAGVAIVNFYGSAATNYLGDPNRWISVNILGTVYKIPMYT